MTARRPIVFVDGQAGPLAKTRSQVPEALFTSSEELAGVLKALRPAG